MKFVVMETCDESFNCMLTHPPYLLEADSSEAARAKVLEEKTGYFSQERGRMQGFRKHHITIHQISKSDKIDFIAVIDAWEAQKAQEAKDAQEARDRAEYLRLQQKFVGNP